MDEIPTVVVKQLGHGSCAECDRGFIVMNRPWGVVQLVESEHFRSRIEEDYIFVIETDHMIMKPPENVATPDRPVGFGFATSRRTRSSRPSSRSSSTWASTSTPSTPSARAHPQAAVAKVARPWWTCRRRCSTTATRR